MASDEANSKLQRDVEEPVTRKTKSYAEFTKAELASSVVAALWECAIAVLQHPKAEVALRSVEGRAIEPPGVPMRNRREIPQLTISEFQVLDELFRATEKAVPELYRDFKPEQRFVRGSERSNPQPEVADTTYESRSIAKERIAEEVTGQIASALKEPLVRFEEGMPGELPEVALRWRRLAPLVTSDANFLRGYLWGLLRKTLDRYHQDDETPERIVDLVMLTIDAIRPTIISLDATQGMLKFFAGWRSLLETQRSKLKPEDYGGYYATRNSIAQYMSSGRPRPEAVTRAVFYFEEILFEYYWLVVAEKISSLTSGDLRAIEVAANNSGNHLDDLKSNEIDKQVAEYWSKISSISVLVGIETSSMSTAVEEDVAMALRPFDGDWVNAKAESDSSGSSHQKSVRQRLFLTIDQMMNSPAAWGATLSGPMEMTLIEILGGLIRASVPTRRQVAGSAFFNAGVSLFRQSTGENRGRQFAAERSIASGIGAWWSLVAASDDIPEAMNECHGLDGLVNFLGAASSMETLTPEIRNNLSRLIASVLATEMIVFGRSTDFERIRGSARSMNLDPDMLRASSVPSGDELRNLVGEVLQQVVESTVFRSKSSETTPENSQIKRSLVKVETLPKQLRASTPELEIASQGENSNEIREALRISALYAFEACESAIRQKNLYSTDEGNKITIASVSASVWKIVQEIAGNPSDIVTEFKEACSKIWTVKSASDQIEPEQSFLVKSGVLTADDYRNERVQSRFQRPTEPGDIVADCDFQWLVESMAKAGQ